LTENVDGAVALDDPDSREALAVFLMRLRRAGVRDVSVLRAVEATPRHLFTPRRYRDLAYREINLPLPCGQTMPHAVFAARLAEAAQCGRGHRLLEIGAGSGYCTAIFARICAEVIAFERYESLVVEARARLAALGLVNASIEHGDGLEAPAALGRFDRIVVHALATPQEVERLAARLEPGGALLVGETSDEGPVLTRHDAARDGATVRRILAPTRLRPLRNGRPRAL
jgi:protein-L-isoaspartate(D-aspartate) O-methyltransferase